jgi:hypothetical protein
MSGHSRWPRAFARTTMRLQAHVQTTKQFGSDEPSKSPLNASGLTVRTPELLTSSHGMGGDIDRASIPTRRFSSPTVSAATAGVELAPPAPSFLDLQGGA